jgi:hypothetical protein
VSIDLGTLERTGIEEGVEYSLELFVSVVAAKVFAELKYLSDPLHGRRVEELIRRLLGALGARLDRPVKADPTKVAYFVADEIDRRYRSQAMRFEVVGEPQEVAPTKFSWPVPESLTMPVDKASVGEWS